MRIAIVGASGKSGPFLATRALAGGHAVVALSRDAARLLRLDPRVERRQADLTDPPGMRTALGGCDAVVSLAHARFAGGLLAALPRECRRVVVVGSVRRYSQLPDPAADAVRNGEGAMVAWRARHDPNGTRSVMLHASMIYGPREDRNVGRVLRFMAAWPRGVPLLVPLPGSGNATVQPVFVEDFVAALLAAATHTGPLPVTIDVVGPEAITYAAFVRACAAALGRTVSIIPVPTGLLLGVAQLLQGVGINLPVQVAELRRGSESKQFSALPLAEMLGVVPRPFAEGVAEKVAHRWF